MRQMSFGMNMHRHIVCLHGFLGSPKDWSALELEKHLQSEISYPNLFADRNQIKPFWDWASGFNSSMKQGTLLIGYSLGGRLAMHAAIQSPELYSGVVIISSHYGLTSKAARLNNDQAWAWRFRNDPWEEVIRDWNSQPVFKNDTHTFTRNEADYSREALARSLDVWSLGRQDYLKDKLKQLPTPLLFIAGEQDTRYASLARSLNHNDTWIVEGAGHRVPWEQPQQFTRVLQDIF